MFRFTWSCSVATATILCQSRPKQTIRCFCKCYVIHSLTVILSLSQYSVYSCILSLIACGVFLRVSFELKVLFLTVASTTYYIIILSTRRKLFMAYGHFLCGRVINWNCSRWD